MAENIKNNIPPSPGIRSYRAFPSRYVEARNVDVWVPPDYNPSESIRYPVLYMHDGQNLFDPALSFSGFVWEADNTMRFLIAEKRVRPAIVVGIWNTPLRMREYLPEKPFHTPEGEKILDHIRDFYGGPPLADAYLRFLFQELKPFVDSNYLTLTGRDDTFIMGSSMGGLISLYALCEYPEIIAGAACLSTHWPSVLGVIENYLKSSLPKPGRHKLYFDYGTETLDKDYEPYQRRIDEVIRETGFKEGEDWLTYRFEGADHSEWSWRQRLHIPLAFLLHE